MRSGVILAPWPDRVSRHLSFPPRHPSHPHPAQVVYASVGTALFFAVVTVLEGRPGDVGGVLAAKFGPTLVANYAIWPVAHLGE